MVMERGLEQWLVCRDEQGEYAPALRPCSDGNFSDLTGRYKGEASEMISANPLPIPEMLFTEPQNTVWLQ